MQSETDTMKRKIQHEVVMNDSAAEASSLLKPPLEQNDTAIHRTGEDVSKEIARTLRSEPRAHEDQHISVPRDTTEMIVLNEIVSPLHTPKAREQVGKQDETMTKTDATTSQAPLSFQIDYPFNPRVPSKDLIEALYNRFIHALKEESGERIDKQRQDMYDSGLLSFEDVIFPALVEVEIQNLKSLQAKVQRDAPHQRSLVEMSRKAVIKSVKAAIGAARHSRLERLCAEEKREQEWSESRSNQRRERQKLLEQRHAEDMHMEELERSRQELAAKKAWPLNQELWREVAYLMTESSKLEKEERLWKEAEQALLARETEMDRRVEALEETNVDEQADTDVVMAEVQEEQCKKVPMKLEALDHAIEDITLSSIRIQETLRLISALVNESDSVRGELYDRYRESHQFKGYRGFHDPKGLIRILSQDPDE